MCAIIFSIKEFYQYLYEFTLVTDHRPLVQIFNPEKSLSICSALRMQHYALFLKAFKYKIWYRQSKAHGNADCLSRLSISEKSDHGFDIADTFEIEVIENLSITKLIKKRMTIQNYKELRVPFYQVKSYLKKIDFKLNNMNLMYKLTF